MSDSEGQVVEFGPFGRRFGRTRSLEDTFVAFAREQAEREKVYAVVGPDSSEEFRARVEAICPVVVDEGARSVCFLVSGYPSEWEDVRAS